MAVSIIGLLLSGFLVFQGVSQGKKQPGEAIVGFLTKMAMVFILFTFVCPNVPRMLLGISNEITVGIDEWFHRTGSATGDNALAQSIWSTKMWAGHSAGQLGNDSKIANAVGYNFPESDKVLKQTIDDMTANGASFADINATISAQAQSFSVTVLGEVKKVAEEVLSQNSTNKAADMAQLDSIMKASQGQDLSKFTYPGKVIGTAAYISFSYLAISIWGMGIASLIWVMIYSMPEEWNMNGILYSGGKAGIGVVLAIILISIYITASLGYADSKAIAKATQDGHDFWVKAQAAFSYTGVAQLYSAGSAVWDAIHNGVGSVVGKAIAAFTGFTLEQFMIAMLILTAPAQAAAIVKGGNGIAEHAKNAMAAQGASSSSLSGMAGMRGGMSGASLGGGQTASSIMAGRGAFAPTQSLNN
jgi:hypothetical protein